MSKQWQPIEDARVSKMLRESEDVLLEVMVKGKRICLVKQGDELHAIDGKCPHQGGPLAEGSINEAGEVVCPWHRFAFDLKSGQSDSGGYFVHTYALEQRGNQWWIKLARKKFWGLF